MWRRGFEGGIPAYPMLASVAVAGCACMAVLYETLGGRENALVRGYLAAGGSLAALAAWGYIVYSHKPGPNLNSRHAQSGASSMEMATTNPLVSLPVEIFSNIIEYLDWGDVGRLDTAFLNREMRNSYLFALQLRKVEVERYGLKKKALNRGELFKEERNEFWRKAVSKGILRKVERNVFWWKAHDRGILSWLISWLIRRNIRVISWDLGVDDAQLVSIANGLPQLQSLDISDCGNITDAGITALANGLPQLQSLNIYGCNKITGAGITALANGCPQLQSLNISGCGNITNEGIRALASGLPQLQSLNIGGCDNVTDEGREIAERINSRR